MNGAERYLHARRLVGVVLVTIFLGSMLGLGRWFAESHASSLPFGIPDPVQPRPDAVSKAPDLPGRTCPLCAEDPGVPIVKLSAQDADSLGRAYSKFNEGLLSYMDSLLQAGDFGDPDSREAQRRAHLLTRLMAVNSLHYMVSFSTDPNVVYEATEETLREAFKKYSDPGVYPIARMVRGRMGMGMVCVRYDLSTDMDSTTTIGAQTLRIRVEETELYGKPERMLIMELPTVLFSVVEVLIGEHFVAKAELVHSNGPPAPYDLYTFHSIDGMYVRKWGTHKPTAMMFWSNPRDLNRKQLPRLPLVGSCTYVPGVRLELPSFLPDLGFEDLRAVDLPQPILSLAYIEGEEYPKWLRRARLRGFKDWETYGPIPPDLRLRFPDL